MRGRSSAGCCRQCCPASRRMASRRRGVRPVAMAAIATTRSRSTTTCLDCSIADVAGKGLPAALLMTNLQAAVRAFSEAAAPPAEVCARVNRLLCRHMVSGRFVTACYLRLDCRNHLLTCANAGHNPPLLVRASGEVVRLSTGGTVLGVFPDLSYEQHLLEIRRRRSPRPLHRRHHRSEFPRRRRIWRRAAGRSDCRSRRSRRSCPHSRTLRGCPRLRARHAAGRRDHCLGSGRCLSLGPNKRWRLEALQAWRAPARL